MLVSEGAAYPHDPLHAYGRLLWDVAMFESQHAAPLHVAVHALWPPAE